MKRRAVFGIWVFLFLAAAQGARAAENEVGCRRITFSNPAVVLTEGEQITFSVDATCTDLIKDGKFDFPASIDVVKWEKKSRAVRFVVSVPFGIVGEMNEGKTVEEYATFTTRGGDIISVFTVSVGKAKKKKID